MPPLTPWFMLALAFKDQLRKLRAVRDEYHLIRISVRYVRETPRHNVGAEAADDALRHLIDLLDIQLCTLALIEADLLEDMHLIEGLLASEAADGPAPPTPGFADQAQIDGDLRDLLSAGIEDVPFREWAPPPDEGTGRSSQDVRTHHLKTLGSLLRSLHPRAMASCLLHEDHAVLLPPAPDTRSGTPIGVPLRVKRIWNVESRGPDFDSLFAQGTLVLAGLWLVSDDQIARFLVEPEDVRQMGVHDPRRVLHGIARRLGRQSSRPRDRLTAALTRGTPARLLHLLQRAWAFQLDDRRTRAEDARIRTYRQAERLRSHGMSVQSELLYRLRRHDESMSATFDVLGSTRRSLHRWVESRPPGYPPVPLAHKHDREFLYRNFRDMVREAAVAMERVAVEVSPFGRRVSSSDPHGVALVPPSVAFTERDSSRVLVDGDRMSIEVPLFFLETPRYFTDIYHECAHEILPEQAHLLDAGALAPWLETLVHRAFARLSLDNRNAGFGGRDSRDRLAMTELLADVLALAVAGPGYAIALFLHALPRSRWSRRDGVWQYFDPMLRARILLEAVSEVWAQALPNTRLSDGRKGGLVQARDVALTEILEPAVKLLDEYERDLVERQAESRDPLASKHAGDALALQRHLYPPMRELAIEVLLGITTKLPRDPDIWVFRRVHEPPESTQPGLERLWSCWEAFTRHTDQELADGDTWLRQGNQLRRKGQGLACLPRRDMPHDLLTEHSSNRLVEPRLVTLNAPHLIWQLWLAQHRHLARRPRDLLWHAPSEVSAFLYLSLMRHTMLARATRAGPQIPRPESWDRDYFGEGKAFTLALFNANWKDLARPGGTRSRVPLAQESWFRPWTDGQWLHCYGRTDFVRLLGQGNGAEDVTRDILDPFRSGYLDEVHYLRQLDFNLLAHALPDGDERTEGLETEEPSRLFLGDEPHSVTVFLQSILLGEGRSREGQGDGSAPEATKPNPDSDYKQRVAAVVSKIESTGELRVRAILRSFSWSDIALWIESELPPARALEGIEQAVRGYSSGSHALLAQYSDTTFMFRWTPFLQGLLSIALPAQTANPFDAASGTDERNIVCDELKAGVIRLVHWYKEVAGAKLNAQSPPRMIAMGVRMWARREGFDQNWPEALKESQEIERSMHPLCQEEGASKTRTPQLVVLNQAFGGEDIIATLRIPGAVPAGRVSLRANGGELTVESGVAAQSFAILLHLLVVRLLIARLDAYEVVTHVQLEGRRGWWADKSTA